MQQTVPGILSRIAEHKRAEMAVRVWDRGALEREAESRRGERRRSGRRRNRDRWNRGNFGERRSSGQLVQRRVRRDLEWRSFWNERQLERLGGRQWRQRALHHASSGLAQ